MEEQQIRERLRHWADAWNSLDEDRIRSLYSEHAVLYQAAAGTSLTGREHMVDRYRDFTEMSDDSKMTVRSMYVDGNTGILEVSLSGTHTGPFLDYEPTGKRFHVETCIVLQFEGEKIVHHTTYFETATLLRNLGLLEIPGTRAEAA